MRASLWLCLCVAAALVTAGAVGISERARPGPDVLEVDLQTAGGAAAQLFWDEDHAFSQERSVRLPLQPDPEVVQRLRFPFPTRGVRWLRFDPSDGPAEVTILRMQAVDVRRRVLRTFDAASLKPANQIASIVQDGEQIRITPTAGANDPIVYFTLGCGVPRWAVSRFAPVTTPSVIIFLLLTGALIAAAIWPVARAVAARQPPGLPVISPALAGLWLLSLFVIVVGTKLLIMREHPLLVPFWDQWDAEARAVYIPFGECSLTWSDMFRLHNEHRVFFTRLLALGELVINRQWDPRLQQTVNAILHAMTGVLLVATLWLALGRRHLDWLVLIGVIVFMPPFAWENILEGFQSAFYFMLLFSVLGLWLMTAQPVGSRTWWIGSGCAMAAVFTAAGGFVVAPVVLGVALLGGSKDRRKPLLLTAAVSVVIVAIAFASLSPPLPQHEPLRAKTLPDLIGALGRNLAWPFIARPFAALLLWMPTAFLLLRRVWTRRWLDDADRYVVGLAAWVVLQAAAVAYGRGAGAPVPPTRYQDFLSLGFVANSVALLILIGSAGSVPAPGRWRAGWWLLAIWLGLGGAQVLRLSAAAIIELEAWRQLWAAQARHVRDFVASGNLEALLAHRGLQLPYPDSQSLAQTLQDPYLRSILPMAVRAPRRVEPQTNTNDAFQPGAVYPATPREAQLRDWGSYSGPGNATQGHFESRPLTPCQDGRDLSFAVAGYLGMPKLTLKVRELATGREALAAPSDYAREAWADVRVPCPSTPFAIVADDERSDYWFAFREPVEVGQLTPLVSRLIAGAPSLVLAGLLLIVLAARWTPPRDGRAGGDGHSRAPSA